jgi:hypothetical protein
MSLVIFLLFVVFGTVGRTLIWRALLFFFKGMVEFYSESIYVSAFLCWKFLYNGFNLITHYRSVYIVYVLWVQYLWVICAKKFINFFLIFQFAGVEVLRIFLYFLLTSISGCCIIPFSSLILFMCVFFIYLVGLNKVLWILLSASLICFIILLVSTSLVFSYFL